MRKSQKTAFYFYFFYIGKFIFCQKTYLEKPSLYCYICFTVFSTWQVIGNAVTPTPKQIFIGFADVILRSKILDNRLGILTQILIAMDYLFVYFRLAINFIIKSIRKRIEILAESLFSFSIIVFNIKFLVILFMRKSICQGKLFGSLHTSNRVYLLWNCFSTMYNILTIFFILLVREIHHCAHR